jgi:hypothetical protein
MKPTGHRPPGDVRPRAARFGLVRAVAAAPAMLGSLLLLTLVSVTLGRWVGLLLPLAWVAGAAVLMTRVGEQMTLRATFGFHRPIPAQAASLKPTWLAGPSSALLRRGRGPGAEGLSTGAACAGPDVEQGLKFAEYGVESQAGAGAFGSRRNWVQNAWASAVSVT